MLHILKETFLSLVLYIIASPLIGWGMITCLFELLPAMGISIKKDKKIKCWVYTSILIFQFSVLIRAFAT